MADSNRNTLQIINRNSIGKVIASTVAFYEPNAIVKRAHQLIPGDIYSGSQIVAIQTVGFDNDKIFLTFRNGHADIFSAGDLVLVDAQNPYEIAAET